MADAYKLKADASFPKAIRKAEELIDGQEIYEVIGINYAAGSYVVETDLTPRDRERAENGELDHLLEPVSSEEAKAAQGSTEFGVFIAEHEAESVIFQNYGHEVVPRDQVLELKSAGAEEAREVLEAAKENGADKRPNLTAAEVPSLVEVSNPDNDVNNVPKESQKVDEDKLVGVEQPPGVNVGETKAAAEADPSAPRKRAGRPPRKPEVEKPVASAPKADDKKDA